ncbi:MAG: hypothetical protein RL660_218 [Bacteroidota bacterium]|jgi:zinc transporter ZupT
MTWLYFLFLFVVACIGGAVPLFINIKEQYQRYVLAFSGSVLLGVSFLHLIPETVADLGGHAGIYMLGGFFLQLLLQRFSHGIEHGHNPNHHHHHHDDVAHAHKHQHVAFGAIFIGLAAHAFLEGIPLGYTFRETNTSNALFIGIAAHKLPEALSLMAFVAVLPYTKFKKIAILIGFAAITPLAGAIAAYYQSQYLATSKIITHLIPVVVGAFIHIATVIFFESETKTHQLNFTKIMAIALGLAMAALTMHL